MSRWRTQDRPDPLRADEVHLWVVPLSAQPEQLSYFRSILSADERERAGRLRKTRDRERRTVAWGSLRYLLSGYGVGEPDEIQFEPGPFGKPGIQSSGANLEFSISHSEERALLGLTLGRRIGVDLEYVRPDLDVLLVAEAHFSCDEFQQLSHLSVSEQREAFYCGWTRKEAYLKACGTGLSIGLDRVRVSFHPTKAAIIDGLGGRSVSSTDWTLKHLSPEAGYLGAVAVEARDVGFKFFRLELHHGFGKLS